MLAGVCSCWWRCIVAHRWKPMREHLRAKADHLARYATHTNTTQTQMASEQSCCCCCSITCAYEIRAIRCEYHNIYVVVRTPQSCQTYLSYFMLFVLDVRFDAARLSNARIKLTAREEIFVRYSTMLVSGSASRATWIIYSFERHYADANIRHTNDSVWYTFMDGNRYGGGVVCPPQT